MASGVDIQPYVDGGNQAAGKSVLEAAFARKWSADYAGRYGPLRFLDDIDLKRNLSGHRTLDDAAAVRNPDLFYWANGYGDVGGVEITTHSPDGSNIEKRYPFVWAARRSSLCAFVATPYLKQRSGGQVNRLPHRHATHNQNLLSEWSPNRISSGLQQLLPVSSLMGVGDLAMVPTTLRAALWDWDRLGEFFANRTAAVVSGGKDSQALLELQAAHTSLQRLVSLCRANTSHTSASTLHRVGNRWIQLYNCRPDTGWWERGEGQFDSIDGRLMFTLDEIEMLPAASRPTSLELWLPQMTSQHPWILEQHALGFGTKRFRNLAVVLPAAPGLSVTFALRYGDQLTNSDWAVLTAHPSLTLERLVARPHLFHLAAAVPSHMVNKVAADAARTVADAASMLTLLARSDVWISTTRAYVPGWQTALQSSILQVKATGTVYVPRVPQHLLNSISTGPGVTLRGGEHCGRPLLLVLRWLYRTGVVEQ